MTGINQDYGDGCWLITTLFYLINQRKEERQERKLRKTTRTLMVVETLWNQQGFTREESESKKTCDLQNKEHGDRERISNNKSFTYNPSSSRAWENKKEQCYKPWAPELERKSRSVKKTRLLMEETMHKGEKLLCQKGETESDAKRAQRRRSRATAANECNYRRTKKTRWKRGPP